jgi:uncharacterized repeat protein (TIGR01451 family)
MTIAMNLAHLVTTNGSPARLARLGLMAALAGAGMGSAQAPPRPATVPAPSRLDPTPPITSTEVLGRTNARTPGMTQTLYDPRQRELRARLAKLERDRVPQPAHLKLTAPKGASFSFFTEGAAELPMNADAQVAVHHLHRYLFALDNLPYSNGNKYFGSIEVLRAPRLPDGVKPEACPVPISFHEQDCLDLGRGQMLTKYIVLERPDYAEGFQSSLDEPIRYDSLGTEDPVRYAKEIGRIVMVVRVGQRIPSTPEIAGEIVPGTLMIQGANPAGPTPSDPWAAPAGFVYADTGTRHPPEGFQKVAHSRPAGGVIAVGHQQRFGHGGVRGNADCDNCAPNAPGGARRGHPVKLPGPSMIEPHQLGGPIGFNYFDDRDLSDDEYLCDGGDRGMKTTISPTGQLRNIDPEDTIATFQTADSRRHFIESNRVCLHAPRYVEVRQVLGSDHFFTLDQPIAAIRDRMAQTEVGTKTDAQTSRTQAAMAMRMRKRASAIESFDVIMNLSEMKVLDGMVVTHVVQVTDNVDGVKQNINSIEPAAGLRIDVVSSMSMMQFPRGLYSGKGVADATMAHTPLTSVAVKENPARPGKLDLKKEASLKHAVPGDTVEFVIRFENVGGEPLYNVAVVDALALRFAYVKDSASGPKGAVFSAGLNADGGEVLRWELPEALAPGAKGEVRFKAKVR